jgi:predicted TIM-barrel fold metal-dependent hydrolase
VKAYNDWMIDAWCGIAPERFIPNVLIPLWDPALAEAELRRCADKGARAFMFSQAPHRLGLPSIHDANGYWDPVFATAQEADLVVCTHLGSSSQLPDAAPDAPFTVSTTLLQFAGQETLLDWIYGSVFDRFPGLKVCLSENGIGWIPAVLEVAEMFIEAGRKGLPIPGETAMDKSEQTRANANVKADTEHEDRGFLGAGSGDAFQAEMQKLAKHLHELDVRERFRQHIYGCFIEDSHGLRTLDEIGVDNVMMESDFPHLTSTYPRTGSVAYEALKDFSAEDRRKLLFENAARVFRWSDELERFADSRPDIDLRGMVSA